MTAFRGAGIIGGTASGPALVTRMPVNFTASFTQATNQVPGWRSRIRDRHHELFRKDVRGTILVYPATIGSTYTGMVLLELMYRGCAPAGIVVGHADSLMVSGSVLADVWFGRGIPVVEYGGSDLLDALRDGMLATVNGTIGEITVP
jgi:hypothetical protein